KPASVRRTHAPSTTTTSASSVPTRATSKNRRCAVFMTSPSADLRDAQEPLQVAQQLFLRHVRRIRGDEIAERIGDQHTSRAQAVLRRDGREPFAVAPLVDARELEPC